MLYCTLISLFYLQAEPRCDAFTNHSDTFQVITQIKAGREWYLKADVPAVMVVEAASIVLGPIQHEHHYKPILPSTNLTHWGRDKMAAISQTTLSNDFFRMKNVWIFIKISMKFVPKAPINNITSLVQIMACRRPGDKPLSEPMMVSLLTHICVTRPQWDTESKCLNVLKMEVTTRDPAWSVASHSFSAVHMYSLKVLIVFLHVASWRDYA